MATPYEPWLWLVARLRRGLAGADREPGDGARRALRGRRRGARGGARRGELRLGPSYDASECVLEFRIGRDERVDGGTRDVCF